MIQDGVATHPPQSLSREKNEQVLSPPGVTTHCKNQMGNCSYATKTNKTQKQNGNSYFSTLNKRTRKNDVTTSVVSDKRV